MLAIVFLSLGQASDQKFDQQFALYPDVNTSPAVTQTEADSGKVKALGKVYRGPGEGQVSLDNGVVRLVCDLSGKVVEFKNRTTKASFASGISSPIIMLNEQIYDFSKAELGLRQIGAQGVLTSKPFDWRPLEGQSGIWPPRGMGLKFTYAHNKIQGLFVERIFEMYDREPSVRQKIVIRNGSTFPVALNQVSGSSAWPEPWLKDLRMNLVLRPGRVLELPDQWVTLGGAGTEAGNGFRAKSRSMLQPWRGLKTEVAPSESITLDQAKMFKKGGTQVLLLPTTVAVNWSSPTQADYDLVANFIKTTKEAKLIPGCIIDLQSIPAEEKDRTGEKNNAVCWLSFAGTHWRQNVMLTWKRMGFDYVQLKGELPTECTRPGHEHQGAAQSEFENREVIKQFVANGLSLGVVIEHPEVNAFGPNNWL